VKEILDDGVVQEATLDILISEVKRARTDALLPLVSSGPHIRLPAHLSLLL